MTEPVIAASGFILIVALFAAVLAMLAHAKARANEVEVAGVVRAVGETRTQLNALRSELKADIHRMERTVNEWRAIRGASDKGGHGIDSEGEP